MDEWLKGDGTHWPDNLTHAPLRWRHVDCAASAARRDDEGCLKSMVGLASLALASVGYVIATGLWQ